MLFDGVPRPANEISRIIPRASEEYTRNLLSYDWISKVISVDGQSTITASSVQVLPGKHKIKMSCEAHPKYTGFPRVSENEFEVTLQPGQLYFPWCEKIVAGVIRGQTRGALPGSTMSTESFVGRFSGYLDTRRVP
jgi:hypothetical protein